MSQFYQPPLDGREEGPFVRDGDDKLIRRSYWLDLSDRSIVLIMTQGIGTRLTAEEKRADVHIRIKLFAHLAPQCVDVAFGAVDLASRKFPESGQMHTIRPTRDKKRVVLFNDGGDDDDGGSQ